MDFSGENHAVDIHSVSLFLGIGICSPLFINLVFDKVIQFVPSHISNALIFILLSTIFPYICMLFTNITEAQLIISILQLALLFCAAYFAVLRNSYSFLNSRLSKILTSFTPLALLIDLISLYLSGDGSLSLLLIALFLVLASLIHLCYVCVRHERQTFNSIFNWTQQHHFKDLFVLFNFLLFLFLFVGIITIIIIQLFVTDIKTWLIVIANIKNVFVCGMIANQVQYMQNLAYSSQVIYNKCY